MHPFPHQYKVAAQTASDGDVTLSAAGVNNIASQAPVEFGGPGDRWSPETLLVAAVADCFALSFRAIAAASKLPFNTLGVAVNGTLEVVSGKMKFTTVQIQASLSIAEDTDPQKAERLLHKAEQSCLVTNSLNCEVSLQADVSTA